MKSAFPETVSNTLAVGRNPASSGSAVLANAIGSGLTAALDRVLSWHDRVRDRRALGQLDEHMLHDIGLSAADVDFEVSKPFWQS